MRGTRNNRKEQIIIIYRRWPMESRAYRRIVYDVQERDGLTLGWIKDGGGDWVVKLERAGHWIVMTGMNCSDLQRGSR